MSGRMTEIPFSYTRDKASFFFSLFWEKEGLSSRRHEQRRIVARRNRHLLIANLRYHLSCTILGAPILNFSTVTSEEKEYIITRRYKYFLLVK